MIWVACTAVVIAAAWFTLRPLFKEPETDLGIEMLAETELDRLLQRKNVIYRNLRDLEFEHKMGRLSDTDFRQLEAGYKSEAAGILQKVDQLNTDELIDDSIEKDVAARKAKLYRSRPKTNKESRRCPACGAEAISGKRYCADCGHQL